MRRDAYGKLSENQYPFIHPVSPRTPTVPWAMYLADGTGTFRMLCFDFDGKKAGEVDEDLMEAAVDDADALSRILDQHAIAHVVCESSGSGGRHIWIHVPAGAGASLVRTLGSAARALYSTLDHGMLSNPKKGAARPPLSPHRDGSCSRILRGSPATLLQSTVDAGQLAHVRDQLLAACPPLAPETALSTEPQAHGPRAHRPLSKAGQSHMDTLGGGENPSWTGFMCLLSAAHAGWTLTDVQRAAGTASGMEHYRTKNIGNGRRQARDQREATARLERQWDKAQQVATTHASLPSPRTPTADVNVADLVRRLDIVDDTMGRVRASPGRWLRTESGHSDRSVLTAIAYLSTATGKDAVAASIRTLAQLTGLGRTTAADALQRLAAAGLLTRTSPADDAGNASEWRLISHFSTASEQVRSQPFENPRPPTVSEVFVRRRILAQQLEDELREARHDVFSRAGLGHLAGRAYALLKHRGVLSIKEASVALGTSRYRATEALSRLLRWGLVVRDRVNGWRSSLRDHRTAVSTALGVSGVLESRRIRYSRERELWAWWIAELDAMHTAPRLRSRRPHATSRPLFQVALSPAERSWPRYPRDSGGRAEHKAARQFVDAGVLDPDNRWQYLGDVA